MSRSSLRILLVAGEASGDLHGAELVGALRQLAPDVSLYALGGARMTAAGATSLFPLAETGIVGLVEVLAHLRTLRKARITAEAFLRREKPDAVVLIDYPGFNLSLAGLIHRMGIPVIYYISPQIWAWNYRRIHRIRKTVNQMLVILPFEERLYRKAGIPVTFVGHPLMDVLPEPEKGPAVFDPKSPFDIGLLPGSRRSEMERHLLPMLHASRRIAEAFPNARFVLPLAEGLTVRSVLDLLEQGPGFRIDPAYAREDLELLPARAPLPVGIGKGLHEIVLVRDRDYRYRTRMAFAVTKSGTSTLENALLGIPMVILYQVSPLTYAIAKRIIRVPWIGLVNVVAEERIVPELIQKDATPSRIAAETLRILENESIYLEMKRNLWAVRQKMGGPGAAMRAAQAILDTVREREKGPA